jgi:hypothetical protein
LVRAEPPSTTGPDSNAESTLKTFLLNRGKPFLRAENPRYPDLIPAQELVIQGVMSEPARSEPEFLRKLSHLTQGSPG